MMEVDHSVAPSEEPDQIIVRVTDDRAIVIRKSSGAKTRRWGRRIADLTNREWKSLLRTFDAATRSYIESRRLTGCLVELHPTDREMLERGFNTITEAGGWLQANLRDGGQVARLMRIRSATGLAAISGGAAVLGAIATQAQAAEMADDIKAIRQRVDGISKHLRDEVIGDVNSVVEQIDELVAMVRHFGRDGVEAGVFPIIQNELRNATKRCTEHLNTAVVALEHPQGYASPRHAAKDLSSGTVEDVTLYLDLLGELHAANVQLGLAQIALYYQEGKIDVASFRAEAIRSWVSELRAEIEGVLSRVDALDESLRILLEAASRGNWVLPAAAAVTPAAYIAARRLVGNKPIRVPGVPIAIPVSGVVAAAGIVPSVVGGLDAVRQSSAAKKLATRLMELEQACNRSTQSLEQATKNLEVLRIVREEIAGTADEVR